MPEDLVRQLDEMTASKGHSNRSQAVAEMVRDRLIENKASIGHDEIAGTITLVYDHHKPNLQHILTDIQHDQHDLIISTVHVHLDHHNCLEVLVVKGEGHRIKNIADRLISAKGVKHGKLTVTATGKEFSH